LEVSVFRMIVHISELYLIFNVLIRVYCPENSLFASTGSHPV